MFPHLGNWMLIQLSQSSFACPLFFFVNLIKRLLNAAIKVNVCDSSSVELMGCGLSSPAIKAASSLSSACRQLSSSYEPIKAGKHKNRIPSFLQPPSSSSIRVQQIQSSVQFALWRSPVLSLLQVRHCILRKNRSTIPKAPTRRVRERKCLKKTVCYIGLSIYIICG